VRSVRSMRSMRSVGKGEFPGRPLLRDLSRTVSRRLACTQPGADATTSPRIAAHLRRASLSNSGWYLHQPITFLTIGEETSGRFALPRVHGGRRDEPLAHSHAQEDETVNLLGGADRLRRRRGGELHARRGATVTIPRGLEHSRRHDSTGVTYLPQFSAAGFERYFYPMSEPAEYPGLPPHPAPTDPARMAAIAARRGCVVAGPLP
jgi:hypothetical protein